MRPANEKEPRHNPNSHPAKVSPHYCKKLKARHLFRYRNGSVNRIHVTGSRNGKHKPYMYDSCVWEYWCIGCGKRNFVYEEMNKTVLAD